MARKEEGRAVTFKDVGSLNKRREHIRTGLEKIEAEG